MEVTFQLVVLNVEQLNTEHGTAKLNVYERLTWVDP